MSSPIEAVRCLTCDAISEADEATSPLYECGACGEIFDSLVKSDSHRCPSCNKFGAKIADLACPICGEGEVEEIQAWEYEGEYFEAKEGVTLEQIVADDLRARAEDEARKTLAKEGPPVTGTKEARQLVPGDWIVLEWGPEKKSAEEVTKVTPRSGQIQVHIGSRSLSLHFDETETVKMTDGGGSR